VVQNDYVRAWDYQKNFLSQVVLLTPDLQSDGLIIVRTGADPLPGFSPTERPNSIGWQRFGLLLSLKCIGDWASSPEIVFVGSNSWKDHLKFGPDGKLRTIGRREREMATGFRFHCTENISRAASLVFAIASGLPSWGRGRGGANVSMQ